ncbi:hypothetical protein [Acinetobacter pittii]|uniref:hypothetical protein n=1 Tax=Acinetobacter pittii TaxID=48296 RepID=UPI003890D083
MKSNYTNIHSLILKSSFLSFSLLLVGCNFPLGDKPYKPFEYVLGEKIIKSFKECSTDIQQILKICSPAASTQQISQAISKCPDVKFEFEKILTPSVVLREVKPAQVLTVNKLNSLLNECMKKAKPNLPDEKDKVIAAQLSVIAEAKYKDIIQDKKIHGDENLMSEEDNAE